MEPSTARARAAVVVVSTSFAAIVGSVNIINPLLPELQRQHSLAAATTAALYSVYLMVLVVVLAALARRPLKRAPRGVLIAALLCTALADLCHASGGLAEIAAGRALLSLGVGLGTPAAAQLAVDLSGGRATTVTATANVSGAFLGTAAGGAALHLSAAPLLAGYLGHAFVIAVLIPSALICLPATTVNSEALVDEHDLLTRGASPTRRQLVGGLALGSVSWIAVGAVVVVAPAAALTAGSDVGSWLTLTVLSMFAAAFWSQHTLGRTTQALRVTGLLILLGMGVVAASVLAAESWLLLAGGVLVGVGYGATLRIGLDVVSRSVGSHRQSRGASLYAGSAYLSAGASMVAGGAIVDRWGGLRRGTGRRGAHALPWRWEVLYTLVGYVRHPACMARA